MHGPVTIITAPRRPTAVLAAATTWAEFAGVWRPLLDEVHAQNVAWGGTGHKGRNVMLYLDDLPHVEVGVELDQPVSISGQVVRSALPGGEVATTVHRGPYGTLGSTHSAVIRWCADAGRPIAGPRWEVYGHWDDDPDKLETEVSYLLG